MAATFVAVTGEDELEELRARSAEGPVLLFKHDPFCSISFVAYRELERLGGEIATVDVASSRALSLVIARQTGVRHESPQVIVFHGGKAVWSASHFAITADAVADALDPDRE